MALAGYFSKMTNWDTRHVNHSDMEVNSRWWYRIIWCFAWRSPPLLRKSSHVVSGTWRAGSCWTCKSDFEESPFTRSHISQWPMATQESRGFAHDQPKSPRAYHAQQGHGSRPQLATWPCRNMQPEATCATAPHVRRRFNHVLARCRSIDVPGRIEQMPSDQSRYPFRSMMFTAANHDLQWVYSDCQWKWLLNDSFLL